jgi:hypothetical protein
MAQAVVEVDITEAKEKLKELTDMANEFYRLIDKSWLLRLIFYGFKGKPEA